MPPNTEVNWRWSGVLGQALAGHFLSEHTISLGSAEAELRTVWLECSSALAGITQRLGAGRVRHLEVKEMWIQERTQDLASEVREDNRADVLTNFVDPDRHHKLMELLPPSVPGTRREVANSVALRVVCSLLTVRATSGN